RMFSRGNSPLRSNASALGAILSWAMRRATSWIMSCSSVKPNSTRRTPDWRETSIVAPRASAGQLPAPPALPALDRARAAAETIHLCIAIVRYAMDLEGWSNRLKVFADATRVRLLALLEGEELTVAELSAITQLAQPRVSTHLARLKEAGLVRDRRAGVSAYYRFDDAALDPAQRALWQTISHGSDDPLLRQDAERVPAVLAMRAADQNWADSVAGDMERHYSPGRTWEALARTALPLLEPGDVLDVASGDGVLAELLAPHAGRYVCVDASARVVAAATERLRRFPNVEVREGGLHALPCADPKIGR